MSRSDTYKLLFQFYQQTCNHASTKRKSSLTVISTTWVLVRSTYGRDRSFFTKLESSARFLNLAIMVMSVSPVMSYTAHTFGNLAICLSRSTILPFVAVISIIPVRSYPSFSWSSIAEYDLIIPSFSSLPTLRSEEHTSELQSRGHLVCRLLLEKNQL